MSFCHHFASANFSYFHLLLWNHWTDLDQTWQKCSLGGTRFVILVQIGNPTWLPVPGPIMWSDWLKLWRSSCQKLLIQWNCNIIEMMTGWSSTNFVLFVLIGNPRWQPQSDLVYNIGPYGNFIQSLFCEKLLDKLNILHYLNVHWMVLYLIYYFGADRKSPWPIMCSDWLKLWRSSCQKLLSRWNCNIIEMMTGWSSTYLFIFVGIGNPKWQSPGDLFYHWTLWEFHWKTFLWKTTRQIEFFA